MLASLSLVLATALTVQAQVKADAAKTYADLLTKYVKNGRVDYKGLAGDSAKLNAYLDAVGAATAPAEKFAAIGFGSADAYNAIVMKAVNDNNRPRSAST